MRVRTGYDALEEDGMGMGRWLGSWVKIAIKDMYLP